jgi:hypothetical protein
VPLLAEAPPTIRPEVVEEQVGAALEFLAAAGFDEDTLRRVATAWDEGRVRPEDLLPRPGRLVAAGLATETGLSVEALDFVACVAIRPVLRDYFAPCREHLPADLWDTGACPFCGAPPGFGELGEDGKLRLDCHVCSGSWAFGRLRCPFCGTGSNADLIHLQGEDSEEGYAIRACGRCRGYFKVVDRRARWNAGPALAEDWGSPHLDLIAARRGYWRPIPTLIQLQRPVE